jgi:hypothetical protein
MNRTQGRLGILLSYLKYLECHYVFIGDIVTRTQISTVIGWQYIFILFHFSEVLGYFEMWSTTGRLLESSLVLFTRCLFFAHK